MAVKNKSPYDVLGVAPSSSDADIKKSYKALAKKYHPDIAPGNAAHEEKFKGISAAFSLLKNKEQRRRFDAGEIDASGAERAQNPFQGGFRGGPNMGGRGADFSDFFAQAFGQGAGGRGAMPIAGGDLRFRLKVDFKEAILGTRKRVTPPHGGALDVTVPPGIRDGQTLRLSGRGRQGQHGGPDGDALIDVSVKPDKLFSRDGDDIYIDLPVSVDEAVLGAVIKVPTISGSVSLTIPAATSSGRKMRLKGRGVKLRSGKSGDQIVTIRIVLPKKIDPAMQQAAQVFRQSSFDPRADWQ